MADSASTQVSPIIGTDEIMKFISEISVGNYDQWNFMFSALTNRLSGFHHLGLNSWDTEAACIAHFYYYRVQQDMNRYSTAWQQILQSRNVEQAKTHLIDYYTFVRATTVELLSRNAIKRELQLPILMGTERALENIEVSFKKLNHDLALEVKQGIDNVISLKSSLNLTGSFQEEITQSHKSLSQKYNLLFWSQLLLILSATALAVVFALTVNYSVENFWQIFAVKSSVAIPILLVWGFLNSEFKITRIEFIKMKHLMSLINGGASAIPQMVSESENAKHDALSKIADSFVDLKHILSAMEKGSNGGSEVDLKTIFELADKIAARK